MNEKEPPHIGNGCPVGGRRVKEEKMQPDESALSSSVDVSSAADYDEPLDFSSRREEDSADATDPIERKISRDSGISVGYVSGGGISSSSSSGSGNAALGGKRPPPGCSPSTADGAVAAAAPAVQQRRQQHPSSRSPSPCSLSGDDSDRTGSAAAAGVAGCSGMVGPADSYMNPALAAIPGAVFPGFPAFFPHGLHPGLAAAAAAAQGHTFWPMAAAAAAAAANPLAAAAAAAVNPLAALIQDQRKLMAAAAAVTAAAGGASNGGGGKAAANGHGSGSSPAASSRSFKQYRDAMNMPTLSYYAMPPFLHVPGTVESAAMAQLMKSQSDELLNIYKQQLAMTDVQDKHSQQQQQPVQQLHSQQHQQRQQSHQRRPRDASASSSPAMPTAVSTPSPTANAGGSSSAFKQRAASSNAAAPPPPLASSSSAAATATCDSQILPGATLLEPTPIKATKADSLLPCAAAGLPTGGGDSAAVAALPTLGTAVASSALIGGSVLSASMAVNMSSASSTHSSLSSDNESFGTSPSSALAAPLPTSTTGRSGNQLPRKRAMRTLPTEQKDDAYWERRRKNNEAAKRSRDARRAKEDEIAIRAAFLEQENLRLRVDLAATRQEVEKLRAALAAQQQTVKGSDGCS